MMDQLRSAIWQWSRRPTVALACLACLIVGVSVLFSTVSLLNSVVMRPLPFHDANRLVMIRSQNIAESRFDQQVSKLDYWDWHAECKTMDMTAFALGRFDVPFSGGYHRIFGLYVTASFFDVLKIQPFLGLDFRDYERSGHRKQLMLGKAAWKKCCEGRLESVGSLLKINNWDAWPATGSQDYALCGVLPPGMRCLPSSSLIDMRGMGPDRLLEFVTPMNPGKEYLTDRGYRNVDVLGRLKPGISIAEAQAEMDWICEQLARRHPESNRDWGAQVVPLHDHVFGNIQPFVVAAFAGSLLVLTIAMGNVAHLLLVVYQQRRGELAIRAAVGATPYELIIQLATEFLLLAGVGVALGFLLSLPLSRFLLSRAPRELRWLSTATELSTVATISLFILICGTVVWWLTLRRMLIPNLSSLLAASARTTSGDHNTTTNLRWLSRWQLLATYLLLMSATVVGLRTRELSRVDPGFRPQNRLSMTISLPQAKHEWNYNSVFCNGVIHKVRSLPEVQNAAAILGLPMGNSSLVGKLSAEGRPLIRRTDVPVTYIRVVTDDYFEAMGIPLLHGRKFNATDAIGTIGNNRTAIVNETMATVCWPDKDPIGRRFKPFDGAQWMEIVGVVGDVHGAGLTQGPSFDIYYPEKLYPQSHISLVVHTKTTQPMNLASDVRNAVLDVDPDAMVSDVASMEQILETSIAERRFGLALLGSLSTIGIFLAGLGVVWSTVHVVHCRAPELRVRIACGANPFDVLATVLQENLRSLCIALVAGWLISWAGASALDLPWADLRHFQLLSTVWVPLVLTIASLLAGLWVASKTAFSPTP